MVAFPNTAGGLLVGLWYQVKYPGEGNGDKATMHPKALVETKWELCRMWSRCIIATLNENMANSTNPKKEN